jgi:hypothetical protein
VIPAINGFIAALTLDNGALVDVSYEPSDNSAWRREEFTPHADEILTSPTRSWRDAFTRR